MHGKNPRHLPGFLLLGTVDPQMLSHNRLSHSILQESQNQHVYLVIHLARKLYKSCQECPPCRSFLVNFTGIINRYDFLRSGISYFSGCRNIDSILSTFLFAHSTQASSAFCLITSIYCLTI